MIEMETAVRPKTTTAAVKQSWTASQHENLVVAASLLLFDCSTYSY
jgi:hypothetical protein